MSMDIPTREEAIKTAQALIEGKKNPKEVAQWAQSLYHPNNKVILEKLEHDDPILEEFIGTLGMADLPGSGQDKLYNIRDFQEWLEEFLEQITPAKWSVREVTVCNAPTIEPG